MDILTPKIQWYNLFQFAKATTRLFDMKVVIENDTNFLNDL